MHADEDSLHLMRECGVTSYLDSEVLGHHAVPGGQISMDKLVGVEVSHAVGDLSRHLKHLFQRRERQAGKLLLQKHGQEAGFVMLKFI